MCVDNSHVGQLLVSAHSCTKEGEEEVLGLQLSEGESGGEEEDEEMEVEEEEEDEDEELKVCFMVSGNLNLLEVT